jgi:hypothetical protein
LAVEGLTDCLTDGQLRTVPGAAGLAMRNPWFAGQVEDLDGEVVGASARAGVCYSAGNLYFVAAEMPDGRWVRLCFWSDEVALPPFGSREFPMAFIPFPRPPPRLPPWGIRFRLPRSAGRR